MKLINLSYKYMSRKNRKIVAKMKMNRISAVIVLTLCFFAANNIKYLRTTKNTNNNLLKYFSYFCKIN